MTWLQCDGKILIFNWKGWAQSNRCGHGRLHKSSDWHFSINLIEVYVTVTQYTDTHSHILSTLNLKKIIMIFLLNINKGLIQISRNLSLGVMDKACLYLNLILKDNNEAFCWTRLHDQPLWIKPSRVCCSIAYHYLLHVSSCMTALLCLLLLFKINMELACTFNALFWSYFIEKNVGFCNL